MKLMKWILDTLIVFFIALLLFTAINVAIALYAPVKNGKGQREQIVDLFIQRHGAETLRAVATAHFERRHPDGGRSSLPGRTS